MDGVIVDTEKIWKQAEKEIFSSLGVHVNEKDCNITQSMTTSQVTQFWYEKFPWEGESLFDVEQFVIHRVIELICSSECCMPGIQHFIEGLKSRKIKVGLATNSPAIIIPVVLEKTNTTYLFDATVSADLEVKGKPHPAVYLTAAEQLNVLPGECLVIEDSPSGIKAARQAGMIVVGFTNGGKNQLSGMVDYVIADFEDNVLQSDNARPTDPKQYIMSHVAYSSKPLV